MAPEEAMEEAIATRQLEWVHESLTRFEFNLTDAIVQACAIGEKVFVELMFNKIFGINDGVGSVEVVITDDTKVLVEKAVLAAAQNGHLDIVTMLLPLVIDLLHDNYTSSWFDVVRGVLDKGAANGHLDLVKFMVQHASINGYAGRYSIWPPIDTLSQAILSGHADVADFLVDQREIFWDLERVFVAALDKGQTVLAERIYDIYPQRGQGKNLFVDLAYQGPLDAVKYLYNNGRDDSGLIGKAFTSAANGKQSEVVKFLVGTGRVSSQAFDIAFKSACSGFENLDVVMFLYNLKRASPQGMDRAFAVTNNMAIMKMLYDNENISQQAVTAAFAKSLSFHYSDHPKIVRFMYKHQCIPSELIDKAFLAATKAQRTDALECLRGDARLSSKVMGEAFVEAVKSCKIDLLKSVYDEKRTPPQALVKAFLEAAHHKQVEFVKEIVNYLSAEEHAPREFMHETFIAAARHGHMPILEIVYRNQSAELPLGVLKDALDASGGNSKIECFIRKLVCDQVFKERRQG